MEKSFYTGKGIGVCILDTGIYEHIDFTGRIWAFYDFLAFKRRPYDDNGHGTHVAGLVAGDGTASMGKYRGAAPGCGIIALKVLDRYGTGSQDDVLRALRWIREYRQQYRIRVVNISVGTTCNSKRNHARLLESVEQLWDEGVVVVTAAGNQGPRPGSITAPGSSKKVITVGSSDLLEGRSAISGRGPTAECVCKPDIVAPGNKIMSCVNEVITLVKDTSLAFVVAVAEMFTLAKQIASSQTTMVPFVVAAVFYYVFNLLVAVIMDKVEKKLNYYR